MKKQVSEGSLHKWFKGSKSKDGKGGWVNVVTGGTCASDEPGEGTPKCVSSSKRASMSKSERLSAARRKKKADPGQQQKSGAAKPTYVSTDKKKKKMKESYTRALTPLSEKAVKCWKGYEKKGTKKMFGKTVNNCVKKEEVEIVDEKRNLGDRMERKQKLYKKTVSKAMDFARNEGEASGHARRNMSRLGDEMEKLGKKRREANEEVEVDASVSEDFYKKKYDVKKGGYVKTDKMDKSNKRSGDSKAQYREVHKDLAKEAYSANPAQQAAIAIAKKKKKEDDMVAKKKKEKMYAGYEPEGETIEEGDKKGKGSGSKDACYHKVKSRYSVWPSAYASGALVKCRKVGAANWGNSSKKEDFSDWKAEFIWEDGDSAKKIEEASSPAWQRKEGKSESGGLNKKGVASYRAANPGSKLKTAVTTKPSKLKRGSKSAKRRKSFCSRMKGMKKKLTSAKTARDPDSRINKALRKWNC